MIHFRVREFTVDATGETFVEYQPYITRVPGFPCFSGELTFSVYQVPKDAPERDHETARINARHNVIQVMTKFSAMLRDSVTGG